MLKERNITLPLSAAVSCFAHNIGQSGSTFKTRFQEFVSNVTSVSDNRK
jgi:hypothetical protein